MKIEVVAYNPIWPALFKEEAKKNRDILEKKHLSGMQTTDFLLNHSLLLAKLFII